jgi:sugar phosphate isomerase/epimerase
MTSPIPLAVSTGSLYPLSTLKSIQELKEIDVRDIELTLQSNEFFLNFERKLSMPILPELLRLVQSGELRVRSVHAPNIPANHAGNLWARNEYLLKSIETCHILGGSLVVIHPLHLFTTQESALEYLVGSKVSLQSALLPGIEPVLERARRSNITLALENIQDWLDEIFFNSPENMSRFLKEIQHPALSFTLDLMHAQVSGFLSEFVNSLAAEIVNVHVSDFAPPTQRVSVGRGVIDWHHLLPALQALPNLRQLTLELSNPQPGELCQSIETLSGLMS